MIKTTFYIGLNDKDTKKQELTIIDAYKIVSNVFYTMTDGATIQECKGIYKHEDGTIVIENTLSAFCLDIDDSKIKQIAKVLKQVLNQESILIEQIESNSQFI